MGKLYYNADFEETIDEMRGVEACGGVTGLNEDYELDPDIFGERLLENQEFIMAAKEYGFLEDDINEDPCGCLAEIYYDGDDIEFIDPFFDLAGLEDDSDWVPVEEAYTNLAKPVVAKAINEIKQFAEERNLEIKSVDDSSIELFVDDEIEDEIDDEIVENIIHKNAESISGRFYDLYEKHTHTPLCYLSLSDEWVADYFIFHW